MLITRLHPFNITQLNNSFKLVSLTALSVEGQRIASFTSTHFFPNCSVLCNPVNIILKLRGITKDNDNVKVCVCVGGETKLPEINSFLLSHIR